jgi:tRNA(Ile2)-agmatinylcytidine synthase
MIIGIDDTDSREGMCTTYLGAVLLDELAAYGTVIGLPLLIRLNPTIPYKTRGNASIAIRLKTTNPEKVMEHVISRIQSLAQMQSETTNPGVVFVIDQDDESTKAALGDFFIHAVQDVIPIETAKNLISKLALPAKGFKNGRGLVGALAACGAMLNDGWDHTYEYIAYRKRKVWGTPRNVDEATIYEADLTTYPDTWDTVDHTNSLIVCVPHSPDPVLYGIRGRTLEDVTSAAQMVKSEPVERSVVYRTNQGTDMHLIPVKSIADIKEMHSYIVEGTVAEQPRTIKGGHVIFPICDDAGVHIDCAAYEPTKNFRTLVRRLVVNDRIVVSGSVTTQTLNIEKLEVRSLAPKYEIQNPECPSCGKRMKSAGHGQGYRCKPCGTTSDSTLRMRIPRNLEIGVYEVPPCARRHLAKPLVRVKREDVLIIPSR